MSPRRLRILKQLRASRAARNRQNRRVRDRGDVRPATPRASRVPPEDRLRAEHAHEPMPRMELVDAPDDDRDRLWIEDELNADVPYELDETGWSPAIELGRAVRVRARPGMRAAVAEVRPGLYLVGLVPEVALGAVERQERRGGRGLAGGMIAQLLRALGPLVQRIGKPRDREPELDDADADVGCCGRPNVGCYGRRCRCGR